MTSRRKTIKGSGMIIKTKGRSKGRENSGDTMALTMKKKITISVLINID